MKSKLGIDEESHHQHKAVDPEDLPMKEEAKLSKEDIDQIKKLFVEQENEISEYEREIEILKESMVKQQQELKTMEQSIKLAKMEYTKQVKENEGTVQRYRKMIQEEKTFAVSKFAKDLLEVRDAIRLALEHTDRDQITKEEDLVALKELFQANIDGQVMTAEVMDKVLSRFGVNQYDPKGEKFDPTLHEAVFTVSQSENENDTVDVVMVTGWKIGDRVLRAAKVGIVKK